MPPHSAACLQVALRPMRRLVNRLSARGAQNAERADVCLQVVSVSIVKELTSPTSLLRLERKAGSHYTYHAPARGLCGGEGSRTPARASAQRTASGWGICPPMGTFVNRLIAKRLPIPLSSFRYVFASVHCLWSILSSPVILRFAEASDVSLLFAFRSLRRACIM